MTHEGMSEKNLWQERDYVHRPRPPTRPPTAGSSTDVRTHSMQRDSWAHRKKNDRWRTQAKPRPARPNLK